MTTINLHQDQQEEKSRFTMKGGNKGFFFSLAILIVTLLIFWGLKWYIPFAQDKNKVLDSTILVENDKLVGLKSLEKVVDLQGRLSEIKKNLQIKDGNVNRGEMTNILNNLAKDLNAGVVVSKFEYVDGVISVAFDANNFSDIAKQILNFKNSSYFTGIEVVDVARRESAVGCNIRMKIK